LKDRKGIRTKIEQKPPSYPNKGLGCHLAPTAIQHGTDEHEFERRELQAQKIASSFVPIPLLPHEAHNVMHGRTMTSVGYSAAVTQFDEDQCKALNTIMNKSLLPKMKVNRHMPHAVVYSPLSLGGLSWPSFQIRQDTESILSMIKHFRWNQTVGQDMLVVLSAWQLASGLCDPIMEQVDINLSFIGKGWFPQIRKRLNNMKGQFWIEQQWTPALQRIHDTSIMKALILSPNISEQTLRILNYVRLFLRVITIADIANEQGITFTNAMVRRTKHINNTTTKHIDTRSPQPASTAIISQSALDIVTTSHGPAHNSKSLHPYNAQKLLTNGERQAPNAH
jgi:hypothetical protein